jgi:His-Xaa-Ser system radical SAM maturase HxsC
MCSQPPKKTHVDRFGYFEEACLLAPRGAVIGITGGEPTLYKEELLCLLERVLEQRDDLTFHVLSNGQHIESNEIERLRQQVFRRVIWGIPLYSSEPALHDEIVAKPGAFDRLQQSFHRLLLAGARIELRTVLLEPNASQLPSLARLISTKLRFVETWSIMQLEHIGFAKNRWSQLYFDHYADFGPIAAAIDTMLIAGLQVRLFNFPLCSVPEAFRRFAAPSISDWKKKFMPGCASCGEQQNCSGFFEWHPIDHPSAKVRPL